MICRVCLFWLRAYWFLSSVVSITLAFTLSWTCGLVTLRYIQKVWIKLLRLWSFLCFVSYYQSLAHIFIIFFIWIQYRSRFNYFLVLNQIRSDWLAFLFYDNKIAFLLLFLIFLYRALCRPLIIDRNSVKRSRIFFSMMIFIMFGFFLFLIELSLPLFVNKLMVISKICKGFFKFTFKDFIAELIFFHLDHFIKLFF